MRWLGRRGKHHALHLRRQLPRWREAIAWCYCHWLTRRRHISGGWGTVATGGSRRRCIARRRPARWRHPAAGAGWCAGWRPHPLATGAGRRSGGGTVIARRRSGKHDRATTGSGDGRACHAWRHGDDGFVALGRPHSGARRCLGCHNGWLGLLFYGGRRTRCHVVTGMVRRATGAAACGWVVTAVAHRCGRRCAHEGGGFWQGGAATAGWGQRTRQMTVRRRHHRHALLQRRVGVRGVGMGVGGRGSGARQTRSGCG